MSQSSDKVGKNSEKLNRYTNIGSNEAAKYENGKQLHRSWFKTQEIRESCTLSVNSSLTL